MPPAKDDGGAPSQFIIDFAAGLFASALAEAFAFPLNRAITIIQAEGANAGLGKPMPASGFFGLFRVIGQTASSLRSPANQSPLSPKKILAA